MSLSVEYVRKYMLDYPVDNYKYEDKIFTDAMIVTAIADAEERAAQIPPLGSSSAGIPDYIIRYGALGILFETKALNSALNFNPGIYENGLQEPVGSEAQMLEQLSNKFMGMFTNTVTRYKVSMNLAITISPRSSGPGSPISSWYRRQGSSGSRWG